DLDDTSVVVPAGHRVRLAVSGTSYPAWVRHPQSDVRDVDAPLADLRARAHLVLPDRDHPSHLTLDVHRVAGPGLDDPDHGPDDPGADASHREGSDHA